MRTGDREGCGCWVPRIVATWSSRLLNSSSSSSGRRLEGDGVWGTNTCGSVGCCCRLAAWTAVRCARERVTTAAPRDRSCPGLRTPRPLPAEAWLASGGEGLASSSAWIGTARLARSMVAVAVRWKAAWRNSYSGSWSSTRVARARRMAGRRRQKSQSVAPELQSKRRSHVKQLAA